MALNGTGLSNAISGTTGVLLDFAGKDPALWDIVEGSFLSDASKKAGKQPVIFHVFVSKVAYGGAVARISDKGGRRKVKYSYPYLDGQTTDDLGRKPGGYDFDILLYGARYKEGLNALIAEVDVPGPGTLRHPVRGDIRCVMEDYELLHQSDTKKAVSIRLMLIEHNFTIGKISEQFKPVKDVKSTLSNALAALKTISAVIDKVSSYQLFAQSFIRQINGLLSSYQNIFGGLLQSFNITFNAGSSTDLPSLLPVNEGGNGVAPGQAGIFPTAATPGTGSDAFTGINLPTSTTPTSVAAQQAIDQVNAARAQCETIIELLSSGAGGQGALDFYDQILSLKVGAIALQEALEAGIQSSNAIVVPYTTPRLMSIREVAFATGLTPDDSDQLEQLNPGILSYNFIPQGTVVLVPQS